MTAKDEWDLPEIYENLIQKLHETAKQVLGEKYKRQSRKTWWPEKIDDLVAKKKKKRKHYIRNG